MMLKMRRGDHDRLTDGIMKALSQNKIITILDFLREDAEKLTMITKLSLPEVLEVRYNYYKLYSAPLTKGSNLLLKFQLGNQFQRTGIGRLDEILGGGLPISCMTEICGLAGSGKTQLCLQLAINVVRNTDSVILYIDTKGDFSAIRVQKILEECGLSHKDMALVMFKIKVVPVWSMDELIELLAQIKRKSIEIENLSLIIIDSLPCLMFQYMGDRFKYGLTLLNNFVNYSRYLCNEFNVSFICVNIQTRWVDQEYQDVNDLEDENESAVSCLKENRVEKKNRCLGRYWQHIPAVVLTTEAEVDTSKENELKMIITLVKSTYSKCNLSCVVTVSNIGVT